jgi:aquaglyceroporin related protein
MKPFPLIKLRKPTTVPKQSWAKVPRYIVAQVAGCFVATLIVHHNYSGAIAALEATSMHSILDEHSAAGNFISIPAKGLSNFGAWFDEFLGTAVLVGYIFVFTDKNLNPSSNLPFALFLLVAGIAAAFGSQTGFAINPGE